MKRLGLAVLGFVLMFIITMLSVALFYVCGYLCFWWFDASVRFLEFLGASEFVAIFGGAACLLALVVSLVNAVMVWNGHRF